MAYEVSSSIAAGNVVATFVPARASTFTKGGVPSPDGSKIATYSYRHGGAGSSDYGIDIWTSSSSGWAESESIDTGANLPRSLEWYNNSEIFAVESNNKLIRYTSGSGGWSADELGSVFTGGHAMMWNPSKTKIAVTDTYQPYSATNLDDDEEMDVYVSSSGDWTRVPFNSVSLEPDGRVTGVTWVDDDNMIIGMPNPDNDNQGRIAHFSFDGTTATKVRQCDGFNGSQGVKQIGWMVHWHSGSEGGDGALLAAGLDSSGYATINYIPSQSDGFIPPSNPHSAAGRELLDLSPIGSTDGGDGNVRQLQGMTFFADPNNGDRIFGQSGYKNGSPYDDSVYFVMETGSSGWKFSELEDNAIQGGIGSLSGLPVGSPYYVGWTTASTSTYGFTVFENIIEANPALESSASETVGSAGGTVKAGGTNSSPLGQVVIPSNALGGNVSIGVDTSHASASAKLGLRTLGQASSNIIRLTPHGTKFSSAVTVTIRLNDGAPTDNLQLLKRNSETGQWYDTGVSLSVSSGAVSFTTTSFSDYLVIGGQKVARTKINNIQLDRLERSNSVLASAVNLTASANTTSLEMIDSDIFLLQSASGESQIISASAMATYMSTKVQPTHIQTTDTDSAGTYRITFTDSTGTDTTTKVYTDGDLLFNAGTNAMSLGILSASSDISGSAALLVGSSATINNGLTVTTGGATVTAGGLTITAGGATITAGGAIVTGAVNMSSTLTAEGIVSGAAGQFDALAGTSLALQAGGITAAGAIAGATTIDASGDLTVGSITNAEFTVDASGNTDIDGTLNVEGVPTFQAGAVFSAGITTAGAIAGASTISGSSTISGHALDIETDANVAGDLTVAGDLLIQGATTTVETTNLLVEDSLIEIARGDGGSRASNEGAGLFISGTLANDVSLTVQGSGGRLKVSGSTPGFDTVFGGSYAINGSSVLNNTTLGSSVVNSSLTSLGTQAEALNMGSQGITAAGAIAGASTVSGSGLASAGGGLAAGFGSQFTVSNAGAVVAASLNNSAGGITNAGAIAGATTIDASGDLTVGSITNAEFTVDASGNTDIDGTLNVEGVPTFQAGAVFSAGVTTAGAIAGATTVSGSGQFSMSHIDLDGTLTAGGVVSGSSFFDMTKDKLRVDGVAVTTTAAELNLLDGVSGLVQADFTKLAAVDATATELNIMDGNTSAASVTLANSDGVVVNDNGTMKQALVSDFSTYLASDGLQVASNKIVISYVCDIFSSASDMGAGLSYDMMSASLSATPLSSSLQVYLNGMLQVISGAVDISGSSAGVYTPVSAWDYKLSDGSSEFGLGNAMDTATRVIFAEALDTDDVVQIKYIKK